MKHASHKATTVSRQKFSLAKALFASGKGSHSVRAVRAVQSAGSDAVVLGLDPAIRSAAPSPCRRGPFHS